MDLQLHNVAVVAVAMGLGAIVGFEREFADKPAGLRTHMFVAAAAAMLMLLGDAVVDAFQQDEGKDFINPDPIRIIQAIVVGISFLGAGTIIHQGNDRVEGLTTAASILLTACVGIAVAVGHWIFAAAIALIAVSVLWCVGWTENKLRNKAQTNPKTKS